jgi:hypothetical protein
MNLKDRLKNGYSINFYNLKQVKEFMPDIKDEQKDITGMPLFKHILLCGATGSGKSNTFITYLYGCQNTFKKPTYDKIFICCKKSETLTEFIKANFDEAHLLISTNINEFPSVDSFADLNKKSKEKYLVIFDDYVNDKDSKTLKKITDYFTYGRNKGITLLFLSQSYFDTLPYIRKNVSYVILNSIKGHRDKQLIFNDLLAKNIESSQLEKMYDYAKTPLNEYDDFPFMKICRDECDIQKKYSKNFIMYLDPNEFK